MKGAVANLASSWLKLAPGIECGILPRVSESEPGQLAWNRLFCRARHAGGYGTICSSTGRDRTAPSGL